MSTEEGPGLREYWAAVESGEEPDLATLVRTFPGEARQLVEADLVRSRRESQGGRRLLWEVRQRILNEAATADTLEGMLKRRRLALGLSPEAVAKQVRSAGQTLVSDTIRNLEDGRIPPSSVPPKVWKLLAGFLKVDGWYLWVLIKSALSTQRAGLTFTRMERDTEPLERGDFVEEVRLHRTPTGVDEYLEDLKRTLGLD